MTRRFHDHMHVVAGGTVLALSGMCVGPVSAQHDTAVRTSVSRAEPATVRVAADAVVSAAPDRAVIDVGVRVEAKEAADAAASNARTSDAVLSALRPVIGADGTIETSGYSVQPRYRPPPAAGGEPELSGYVVVNTVTVTVMDLGQVGRVIDTALGAGANQLFGLTWTLGDEQTVRLRALRQAVATARAKAEAITGELGMRLVRVVSVEEGAPERGPRPMRFERSVTAADVATPTEPAPVTFRSTVTLTAELATR